MATADQLLALLRNRIVLSGAELALRLGVSRATLSRLVEAAGERVVRMGRGRATRYSIARPLPGLGASLPVYRIDAAGAPHLDGALHPLIDSKYWLERTERPGELFAGLPPFAEDMSPQGYIGRGFPGRYPELGLPPGVQHWSDEQRLIAIARRGEDCVGNLILGEESFARFLQSEPRNVDRQSYPALANSSLEDRAGSSAGGEQPKFGCYSEGRHVLVKFSRLDGGAAAARWSDLLWCERIALETVAEAGISAVVADVFDLGGYRFLEIIRMDRIGLRGRRGLRSLGALDKEYLGLAEDWTKAAARLLELKWLRVNDARNIRWADAFGQLIGNTDRHFGNLSFFPEDEPNLRLAPIYDMLPMIFAPSGAHVVEREFSPAPPRANNLDVWSDAAKWAAEYWNRLAGTPQLNTAFRERCGRAHTAVRTLLSRVTGILLEDSPKSV